MRGIDLTIKTPKDILTEEFIVSATRASETTPSDISRWTKEEIAAEILVRDFPILPQFHPSVVYTRCRMVVWLLRGVGSAGHGPNDQCDGHGIPLNDCRQSHGGLYWSWICWLLPFLSWKYFKSNCAFGLQPMCGYFWRQSRSHFQIRITSRGRGYAEIGSWFWASFNTFRE